MTIGVPIIIIIITDLYSAFRSEDTEAQSSQVYQDCTNSVTIV